MAFGHRLRYGYVKKSKMATMLVPNLTHHVSKVFSLKDRGLVLNLATMVFGDTVVYSRGV